LSFCHLSLGYCSVCPSSIYSFWVPFCYLQNWRWRLTELK
jgi:hypothetical protein